MPEYRLASPTPLKDSQWRNMYNTFMENGLDVSRYRPGTVLNTPVTGIGSGTDNPNRDGKVGGGYNASGGGVDPSPTTTDPARQNDVVGGGSEDTRVRDAAEEDNISRGTGTSRDTGFDPDGPNGYDLPAWRQAFAGMSDAMLDKLGNALRGKNKLSWKDLLALGIPGGTTTKYLANKWIGAEQNRRAQDRMSPDTNPEWFRDPETGSINWREYYKATGREGNPGGLIGLGGDQWEGGATMPGSGGGPSGNRYGGTPSNSDFYQGGRWNPSINGGPSNASRNTNPGGGFWNFGMGWGAEDPDVAARIDYQTEDG